MNLRDWVATQGPGLMVADGHDDAIIGVLKTPEGRTVVVYDSQKVIDGVEDQCESRLDAEEFCAFNIWGAYVGPGTPMFVEVLNVRP
jgi:hypothetical protein